MVDGPLHDHDHAEPSAFTPEALLDAVGALRALPHVRVPEVVVLDFDGDLYDELLRSGRGEPWPTWACFHTPMIAVRVGEAACGVVPRTIGGPMTRVRLTGSRCHSLMNFE